MLLLSILTVRCNFNHCSKCSETFSIWTQHVIKTKFTTILFHQFSGKYHSMHLVTMFHSVWCCVGYLNFVFVCVSFLPVQWLMVFKSSANSWSFRALTSKLHPTRLFQHFYLHSPIRMKGNFFSDLVTFTCILKLHTQYLGFNGIHAYCISKHYLLGNSQWQKWQNNGVVSSTIRFYSEF